MSIISQLMSMQAIAGKHDAAANFYEASQERLALANSVQFGMSSAQVKSVAEQDKILALQSQHARVMFQAYQYMQESAQQMEQEDTNQKRRLMAMGATFV